MKVEPREQIFPSWIEKYRPESHCDGRETSARLDSIKCRNSENAHVQGAEIFVSSDFRQPGFFQRLIKETLINLPGRKNVSISGIGILMYS